MHLADVGVGSIIQESHWKLVAAKEDRVRIMLLARQACAEMVQRLL